GSNSLARFLAELAAFYAILAGVRNCRVRPESTATSFKKVLSALDRRFAGPLRPLHLTDASCRHDVKTADGRRRPWEDLLRSNQAGPCCKECDGNDPHSHPGRLPKRCAGDGRLVAARRARRDTKRSAVALRLPRRPIRCQTAPASPPVGR